MICYTRENAHAQFQLNTDVACSLIKKGTKNSNNNKIKPIANSKKKTYIYSLEKRE